MTQPFRWNIAKKEQLGQLIAGESAEHYPEFPADIRTCAARVLSFSDDAELYFVGRSPESIFDYVSGIFTATAYEDRCRLLNISNRHFSFSEIARHYPQGLAGISDHLSGVGLDPSAILHRKGLTALVDVVARGGTFEHIHEILTYLAEQDAVPLRELRAKIRFIGITWRTKNSPNTWRWHQHQEWLSEYGPSAVKNVSVPGRLWDYIGNYQLKVMAANPPHRWGLEESPEYRHNPHKLQALRLALSLYESGLNKNERARLAAEMVTQPAMTERWYRDMVQEIKK